MQRVRRIPIGPAASIGEDVVLAALRTARRVGERWIAIPMRLAIVLAGADGDHVLRGARRVDRFEIDHAIGVGIGSRIAR